MPRAASAGAAGSSNGNRNGNGANAASSPPTNGGSDIASRSAIAFKDVVRQETVAKQQRGRPKKVDPNGQPKKVTPSEKARIKAEKVREMGR